MSRRQLLVLLTLVPVVLVGSYLAGRALTHDADPLGLEITDAAGETLTQRFNSPGVLEGACSVHSSDEFVLRVEA